MIIKVMTYNLHKGKNIFGRPYDIDRLKMTLDEESCDIGFLQEVLGYHNTDKEITSQSELLAGQGWEKHAFSKNSIAKNFEYGNSIISKYPIIKEKKIDLTLNRLEKRSALFSLIDFGDFKAQCICTHLNLRKSDRYKQAQMLLNFIQEHEEKDLPIILGGDFNDTDGSVSNFLIKEGGFFDLEDKSSSLTFPSILPFLSLDRILFKNLQVIESKVGASKKYRPYSDHLPLFYKFMRKKL